MRGERSAGGRPAWACLGSSPHARGTLDAAPVDAPISRFIPACAGNAPAGGGLTTNTGGSSPHARGTLCCAPDQQHGTRFIPACAGNAFAGPGGPGLYPVHPRMRGERERRPKAARPAPGSSPHARGTRMRSKPGRISRRFIPACAGNAMASSSGWEDRAVHPRMRGERRSIQPPPGARNGSSPHARGTHFQ